MHHRIDRFGRMDGHRESPDDPGISKTNAIYLRGWKWRRAAFSIRKKIIGDEVNSKSNNTTSLGDRLAEVDLESGSAGQEGQMRKNN